jgi:outer membrane receptor protein involved in Fe transport
MNLSGPMPFADPTKYNFFVAGEYVRDNTSLPHNYNISYTGVGRVSLQPAPRLKVLVNGAYQHDFGDRYTHRDVNGRSYDFDLGGLPSFKTKAYLAGVSANYAMTDISIVSISVNRFRTYSKQAPKRYFDLYWRDWPGYTVDSAGNYNGTIDDENYLNSRDYSDAYQATGFATGSDYLPAYRWRSAAYNSVAASWLSQMNKTNEVKIGFSYRRYDIDWDTKLFYNANPYGEKYSSNPIYTSWFAQDKLEYRDIILNLGLRYDYRNADIDYNSTPGDTIARYVKAKSKSELSPRLGVSFPISEGGVVRFNYGVYFQTPQFTTMYTNLQGDLSTGLPLIGNPDLKSEVTKSYELGVTQMLQEDLRFSVTAYYKDMKDLVTTRSDFKIAGNPVTQYRNGDYGTAKGFDLLLERLPKNGIFSGSIAYSYLIAMGNGSYALEPYYTYLKSTVDSLPPVKEYALDFDQRHTLTAVADFRIPKDWKGSLFGMPIPGAWGVTVVGYVGSGLPYTKSDNVGNRIGERNEGRLPTQSRVDMRVNKDFAVGLKQQAVTFFVEVDNLFNTHNIQNVYTNTGLPDNDNNRVGTSGLVTRADEIARLDRLYDHDPQNYSVPRTVRTGIEYSF